jgi:hypothetical protein
MDNEIKENIVNKLSNKYSPNDINEYIDKNESFFDKLFSNELQRIVSFSIVFSAYIMWMISIVAKIDWLKDSSIVVFILALMYSVFPKKFLKGYMFYIFLILSIVNIYSSILLIGDSLVALIITGAIIMMKFHNPR